MHDLPHLSIDLFTIDAGAGGGGGIFAVLNL